ncbi:MAG: hypothetical protein CUN53_21825, partial [Phototrophicales bacterium]
WTLTALAIIGVWLSWRRALHVIIVGVCLWVIALGPKIWILGHESGIPLPYAWLDRIPLFGAARKPALFVAPVLALLSVLAAIGLEELRQRLPSLWRAAPV